MLDQLLGGGSDLPMGDPFAPAPNVEIEVHEFNPLGGLQGLSGVIHPPHATSFGHFFKNIAKPGPHPKLVVKDNKKKENKKDEKKQEEQKKKEDADPKNAKDDDWATKKDAKKEAPIKAVKLN